MGKFPFVIEDPRGDIITLTSSNYYGHIKMHHPDIKIGMIIETIKNPDVIYENPDNVDRQDYYKTKTLSSGKSAYTKVITEKNVDKEGSVCNFTVTAYTTKKIKGDASREKYKNNDI